LSIADCQMPISDYLGKNVLSNRQLKIGN